MTWLVTEEARRNSKGITYLKKILGCTALYWSHGTEYICGTCTIIMPTFTGKICSFRTDHDGRLVSLDVALNNRRIRLIYVYAPNKNSQRSNFFCSLEGFLEGPFEELVVGWDFNCVLDEALDRQSNGRVTCDSSIKTLESTTNNLGLINAWRHLNGNTFDFTWFARVLTDTMYQMIGLKEIWNVTSLMSVAARTICLTIGQCTFHAIFLLDLIMEPDYGD